MNTSPADLTSRGDAGAFDGGERAADDALDVLKAAIESLPIGVLLVGRDGVIRMANREIERLFDHDGTELAGQSVDVLLPDASLSPDAVVGSSFLEQPLPRRIASGREIFGRRRDGSEVPIEVVLTPITFRGMPLVVVSVVDLTERRRMQAGLQAAIDERLEFERLVAELGAEFVNLRPDDVDRAVEEALGRLVRSLGLDRSALFQVEPNGDFVHTHQWTRPGWAPSPPRVSAGEQFPWHLAQVRAGELVSFAGVDEVPDERDREGFRRLGTKSNVTVPLAIGGEVYGALTFASVREHRSWTPAEISRLRVVGHLFANALARKIADERLRATLDELAALRDRLRKENLYLRDELNAVTGTAVVVGHSPAMRRVLGHVRQVGPTDSTVLLIGETGTGRTLLAAKIHEHSARSEHPLVRVNCAHLAPAWMENELVGSQGGVYGGHEPRRVGRMEIANGSTVFLDEVADLPLEAQATLTRLLEDKRLQPPGVAQPLPVDVRIIAATRKDLKRCIDEGTFRDDLFYRLNVFPIHVPPLRERREDIPLLVWRFVDEFSATYGAQVDAIDQASMAALESYAWPGNARELRNVIERAMIVATGHRLRIPAPANGWGGQRRSETLAAVEKEHIAAVIAACGDRIEGPDSAAERLGVSPAALRAKMRHLGMRRTNSGRTRTSR
jgi:PAS domain S-box-containing protein